VQVTIKTIKIPEAQTTGKSTQAGDKDRRRATTAGTGGGKEKRLLGELLPRKMIVKSNSIHHREHGARDLGPPLKVRLLSSTYAEIRYGVCVWCACVWCAWCACAVLVMTCLTFSQIPLPPILFAPRSTMSIAYYLLSFSACSLLSQGHGTDARS
jgi:hypothetical protein